MAGQRGTGSIRLLLYAYRTLGFLGDLLGLKCASVKYSRLTLNLVVGCNWNYQIISLLSCYRRRKKSCFDMENFRINPNIMEITIVIHF